MFVKEARAGLTDAELKHDRDRLHGQRKCERGGLEPCGAYCAPFASMHPAAGRLERAD